MKVSVQNHNKPLPFIGAAVQGVTSLIGAGISAAQNSVQSSKQRKHDERMAQLNQQYNEENMATQNRYQVEQWERENEYNDPSAVASRYRNAGISPQAALGGSASGAGIAGGLSSAPSGSGNMGSSSTLPHANSFSNLGEGLSTAMRIDAQNKKDEAEARLAEEKALSEYFERTFIKPHTARLQSVLADKGVSEADIKKVEAQWAPYMADLEGRLKEAKINDTLQGIEESKQRIIESESVTALKEEERDLVAQQINETAERVKSYALERDYKRALTTLTKNQSMVAQMDAALKQAQKGHTEALVKQIDKEIEYIGKRMQLTDAQIKKWKEEIKHMWSEFGVKTAQATSSEVREWMFGWIPLRGNHRPIGFGKE